MTEEEKAAVRLLRKAGYAVVVFNTEELDDVPRGVFEQWLVEFGNKLLDKRRKEDQDE